jgi:hypothetical protein
MSRNDLERAALTALTAAGAGALRRWLKSRRPGTARLLRGALAGAGAAGVVVGLRALRGQGGEPNAWVDQLLAGAGKGVIYTAVIDPLLPGPPALRGALVGAAEYLAAPWGGALRRVAELSPTDRIPVVSALLAAGDEEEDPLLAHLLFGVALGLLTGDASDSRGDHED